jgi:protein-disulfide isomerase
MKEIAILIGFAVAFHCYSKDVTANQLVAAENKKNSDNNGNPKSNAKADGDESFSTHLKKVNFPEKYRLKEIVVGKDSAPINLIIYFSYTCPHCREFHSKEYPKFKKMYVDTGKVKITFRNYIDDQGALEAAQIVRCLCGWSVDEYMKLSHLVIGQQVAWMASKDPANFLKNIFIKHGITKKTVNACLKRADIGAGLMIEQKRAMNELNIPSVPAFMVNGKMHIGGITGEELAKMCELTCDSTSSGLK